LNQATRRTVAFFAHPQLPELRRDLVPVEGSERVRLDAEIHGDFAGGGLLRIHRSSEQQHPDHPSNRHQARSPDMLNTGSAGQRMQST
jgi:hypothetical protein